MKKFTIYEVWTRSFVVEAKSASEALTLFEPEPVEGMNLANWHAVSHDEPVTAAPDYTGKVTRHTKVLRG
jgi:hypothetical protein